MGPDVRISSSIIHLLLHDDESEHKMVTVLKCLLCLADFFWGDNIMSLETHCDPGPYDVKGIEILQRFWVPGENSCDGNAALELSENSLLLT